MDMVSEEVDNTLLALNCSGLRSLNFKKRIGWCVSREHSQYGFEGPLPDTFLADIFLAGYPYTALYRRTFQ